MQHEIPAVASPAQGGSGMTHDEIVAFFQRREDLDNDFDAAALAADYADAAVIDSPIAGVRTRPLAAEQALKAVFAAFLDTAVFLYELRDHHIVRERRIYDFTGLLVQIGVLKAKPV
jgi:hypothetical protein